MRYIQMGDQVRLLPSPLPVSSIAYLPDNFHNHPTTHTRIDFGLELASEAGFAEYSIDGQTFRKQFPWCSTRMPGHVYRMSTKKPWDVLVFTFEASNLEPLRKFGLDPANPGWEFRMTPEISARISRLFLLMDSYRIPGHADQLDLLSLEILRMTLLCRRDETASPEEILIHRIASCLATQIREKPSLDSLIRKHNLSRRTFFRHWKKYYDSSPWEFILKKRIETAVRLLQETEMRIYEIADRLQFVDSSYFCRQFRRMTGMTPNECRRSLRPETSHSPERGENPDLRRERRRKLHPS